MISAVSWIPKGVAKAIPVEVEPPSKEEIDEILKSGALERSADSDDEENEEMDLDAAKKAAEVSQALAAADALDQKNRSTSFGSEYITDALRELDMDHYDDEDDGIEVFSTGLGDRFYPSNDMDPYLKKDKDDADEDEDDEEIEDMTIKPSDAVIVCARNDDDISQLQVCVFEELEDGDFNLYSHHDIILPAFPLCTAWLDCNLKGGDKGNFIAIGSMEPAIEIWDLDLVDEIQPFLVLGSVAKTKKKGKKTSVKYKKDSHTDSVLGLAWNKEVRKYLASASADTSVKIWDLVTGECFHTREHHTDKARFILKLVQAVAWNGHVPDVLLSGSFDRSVVLMDMRYPSHTGIKSSVAADVESLAWDPYDQHSFVVSLEDGTVQGFDVRAATSDPTLGCKPCFTLHAHDKAVSSVSFSPTAPKLLATGSMDKMVKLWDLSNNQPSCIASKNPKAGAVFSISFSVDSPFLLAVGGSKGDLQVWDTLTEVGVARKFGKYSSRKVEPVVAATADADASPEGEDMTDSDQE
ncbi:WD40 repeat [Macleaya cordata]|uniref:WD40 repeat n=1 Tax=Macleaya cordata TaxID=56857 RepID=A0A200QHR9_MACCD|nr:WD40 repeat [Macleaya cordata]